MLPHDRGELYEALLILPVYTADLTGLREVEVLCTTETDPGLAVCEVSPKRWL
jgi:hypothetical protein